MTVHVRHRLARLLAILDRDIEAAVTDGSGGGARQKVSASEHALDLLHSGEKVGYFGGGEFREALDLAIWDYECVPGEDWLDVHEGVA